MASKPKIVESSDKLKDSAVRTKDSAAHMERSTARVEDSADRRTELAADRTILRRRTDLCRVGAHRPCRDGKRDRREALLTDILPQWLIMVTGSVFLLFSVFCFGAAVWRHLYPGPPPSARCSSHAPCAAGLRQCCAGIDFDRGVDRHLVQLSAR